MNSEKVEKGKIVRFHETITSLLHGPWGTFDRIICYPNETGVIAPDILTHLEGKSAGDEFTLDQEWVGKLAYDPDLIFNVPLSNFSGCQAIKPGMVFITQVRNAPLNAIVKEVDRDQVTIDCNPPFCGAENLTVKIVVVEVRDKTKSEEINFTPVRLVV